MKHLFILVSLFICTSVFAQFRNPKILPLETEYDFGNIKEGEVVSHNFVIFNKGTDILKIDKIKKMAQKMKSIQPKI